MAYTFIDHGSWIQYEREEISEGWHPSALFAKRESDGIDWYDYARNPATWQPGSVKMTCLPVRGSLRTQAIVRDESYLFPAKCRVIEILGVDPTDEKPHRLFEGQVFDLETETFGPIPKPPVLSVSKAQGKLALLDAGLLDLVEGFIVNASRSTQIWYADANDWLRNHPEIETLGGALNLSDAQIDALFEAASLK